MSIKEKNGNKEIILTQEEILFIEKENNSANARSINASEELRIQNDFKQEKTSKVLISSRKKIIPDTIKKNSVTEFIAAYNDPTFQNKIKQEAQTQNFQEQLIAKDLQLSSYINAVDTTNASIEFDLEGNILCANKNFLEIMGYKEIDLIGKHHRLLVDSSYAESHAYQLFWNSLKKGIHQKDEFIRVAKNGKLIWLFGSYNPIFDAKGKLYKILKIATDITLAKTQFLQLAVQAQEKEKRASELVIANKELAFQNEEKEKRAAELIIANKELKFQNEQKEKRAQELVIANKELAVQSEEKEKRASELVIANKELAFQNEEKEKRAAELIIANKELKFQNGQKEKRAQELIIANKELAIQSKGKEKSASELVIANNELAFQNEEKEKRAAELVIANKELAFQNKEKEKRAAELIIANKKLAAENILKQKRKAEKEKRTAELIVSNRELAYQEKRSIELTLANDELKKAQEELESFSYSVSHDLRAPIRAINGYTQILVEDHADSIDEDGQKILHAIIQNSKKMGILIDDLLSFSKLGRKEVTFASIDMTQLIQGVISEITIEEDENIPIFEMAELEQAAGDPSLIKQVWINLISNAIKYSKYKAETRIKITSTYKKDKIIYSIQDWGAGFDMEYYDKLFGVFQRLHSQEEFVGTGIGLAIVEKIINRHSGKVWAESKLDEGATFYFSLPVIKH